MNLIIIAGMPATGKTTLAKKIAGQLGMPMLEKDEIKEEMYKVLGYDGLEDRRIDDIAANNILLRCTENILRSGTSLLIVNNFDKEMRPQVQELIDSTGCNCVLIFLDGDPDVLYQRYVERDATHSRHSVHELWDRYPPLPGDEPKTMTRQLFREVFEDLGMSEFQIRAHRINLDATDPGSIDVDRLISRLEGVLE